MNTKKKIINKALYWTGDKEKNDTKDKEVFIKYLAKHCDGYQNKKSIKSILTALSPYLSKAYSKESFQQNIIVPFREDKDVFVGTSGKGIYLVTDASDASETFRFYSTRIRSEQKHWKNLKTISGRYSFFRFANSGDTASRNCHIFFDESGSATLNWNPNDPVFVVTSIIFKSNSEIKKASKYLNFLRKDVLHKNDRFEIKSNNLSKKELKLVLKHINILDFECNAICFIKQNIKGKGFNHSNTFRKFAFQRMLDKVAPFINSSSLYFDSFSGKKFEAEFLKYIKKQNVGYPASLFVGMKMIDSKYHPGCNIADVIAGSVRNDFLEKTDFTSAIEQKFLYDVEYYPYYKVNDK